MVYKAVTVHSFAALPVNVITSLVLNKYAKKCFEEKKEMTGQDIVDYALKETVCASGTPFGRRDACYLIANNPEEAVKTCADIRSSGDNGEIRRTNPFQNPKAFAARMLQGSLEDAVRDYAEIRGVSMEDKISPVFFALAHDRYSGTAELGLDAKEKVYIPSDSSVDFNTRVIYAYPEVCRMLAKAEDGSRFDDVVYSADANPSAAGVFGGIARKASLWTCLTQDAPIISKMYMDAMLKGGTDFCREMGNPIANIRIIESAYIVDRVLIALGSDLMANGIHGTTIGDDCDYIVTTESRDVLLTLAKEDQERNGLSEVVGFTKTWVHKVP